MELGDFVRVCNPRHPLHCLGGKIVGKRGNCAPNDLWCLVYFPARMRSHLVPESMLKLDEAPLPEGPSFLHNPGPE